MKSDDEFVHALRSSDKAVQHIARLLRKRGNPTKVNPLLVRPDRDQWKDYADKGDIHITMRLEVKQRKDDVFLPNGTYRHSTIIIDETYKIDEPKDLKLLGYLIVDKTIRWGFFVPYHTRKYWKDEERYDKKDREYKLFKMVHIEHCIPLDLEKLMMEEQ